MEIWKDVPGYEGIYEVSNIGRVRTKEGKTTHSVRHGKRVWKSRVLKEKDPNGRDVRVSLWKNKIDRTFLVHRLVAMAFIPNPNGYGSINHIDGNPRNNRVENLEWCTHKMNNNHAFDNGLIKTGYKTTLIRKSDGKKKTFRSMSKAGEYLNVHQSVLSYKKKKSDVFEIDEYIVIVEAS
ncbi:NUMOD4 motif-containing HNH endonuclease [Atopococcus tabaci]|uniref:NUMOD4 motif-containing HNH endonuclease n=1 Tax=Atopococcus tabaci TaxID=269774 RepID=UPI00240A83FD|nr:NUMOD4 motif-containing HNH endonuclease [Atopococcus tabaci]